jgi:hypothetical protein
MLLNQDLIFAIKIISNFSLLYVISTISFVCVYVFYDYFLIFLEIELLGQRIGMFFKLKCLIYIAELSFRKFIPIYIPVSNVGCSYLSELSPILGICVFLLSLSI